MPRKISIATTSLATFEDVTPPYNLRHPSKQENLDLGLSLLDAAGKQQVDLACLPEAFTTAGMLYAASTFANVAEPLDGPTFQALAERARRYEMYVVAGLPVVVGAQFQNVAVLINRQGELVGKYAKMHPTDGEIGCGIVPGSQLGVFQTDFGRVGLAICFDINWPDMWATMAQQGAELVCWLSAYPGGFPLQAYAWTHKYHIVSSVWPYEARIIDMMGQILVSGTRWGRLITSDLDLDKRLFHTDGQYQQILALQERYGPRIRVQTYSDEHLFTVEVLDPQLSVEDIISEFNLIEYDRFIARCTEAQQQAQGEHT
jgi:beta-ureidopropionase